MSAVHLALPASPVSVSGKHPAPPPQGAQARSSCPSAAGRPPARQQDAAPSLTLLATCETGGVSVLPHPWLAHHQSATGAGHITWRRQRGGQGSREGHNTKALCCIRKALLALAPGPHGRTSSGELAARCLEALLATPLWPFFPPSAVLQSCTSSRVTTRPIWRGRGWRGRRRARPGLTSTTR